jgi:hypothetical protein
MEQPVSGIAERTGTVAKPIPVSSNEIIEGRLDELACETEEIIGGKTIAINFGLVPGADNYVRDLIEGRAGRRRGAKILVILETDGGLVEVARRIAEILHHHYRTVDYLIPDHAWSAGTILAMSGDSIYMDQFSVLGPIDPQVRSTSGGPWVPGLGYVEKFNALMDKANTSKGLNTAEMTYLVEKFDPGMLYWIEQERNLSIRLLKDWLVKYKFKNWKRTETRKLAVTKAMKLQRAEEIAAKLNDTKLWHSHGRGIPMNVARQTLNLKIQNFAKQSDLNVAVRTYHNLFTDYMGRRGHTDALHQNGTYLGFNRDD